jgi:hypothetical protein
VTFTIKMPKLPKMQRTTIIGAACLLLLTSAVVFAWGIAMHVPTVEETCTQMVRVGMQNPTLSNNQMALGLYMTSAAPLCESMMGSLKRLSPKRYAAAAPCIVRADTKETIDRCLEEAKAADPTFGPPPTLEPVVATPTPAPAAPAVYAAPTDSDACLKYTLFDNGHRKTFDQCLAALAGLPSQERPIARGCLAMATSVRDVDFCIKKQH